MRSSAAERLVLPHFGAGGLPISRGERANLVPHRLSGRCSSLKQCFTGGYVYSFAVSLILDFAIRKIPHTTNPAAMK